MIIRITIVIRTVTISVILIVGADFLFRVPGHNLRDYIRATLTIGRKCVYAH